MATKPNMYIGAEKKLKTAIDAINNCIMMSYYQKDGTKDAAVYDMCEVTSLRDYILLVIGETQVLITGLDTGSKVRAKYENLLKPLYTFIYETKRWLSEPYERS